jgi:hypothetical protein
MATLLLKTKAHTRQSISNFLMESLSEAALYALPLYTLGCREAKGRDKPLDPHPARGK